MVDLLGVGRSDGAIRDQSKASVAPATTQLHWQDPSLSTESSRGEKPSACFSVLGVAGSSLSGASYPNNNNKKSVFSNILLLTCLAEGTCCFCPFARLRLNLFSIIGEIKNSTTTVFPLNYDIVAGQKTAKLLSQSYLSVIN